jgi:hypothetical protein
MLTALYLILSVLFVVLVWQVLNIKKNNYVGLLLLVLAGLFWLSGNCRDFSTLWRKKRILAKNTPIYGGYHGNSQ